MKSHTSPAFCAIRAVLAISTFALFNAAHAQDYYGEIGLTPIHLKSEVGDISHPQTIRFLFGKDVHENLAIEALYLTTYSKDSRPGFDAQSTHYGFVIKPKYALTSETIAFARFGVAHANFTASSEGSRTGLDLAYGLGLQTLLSKSLYGQIDYMNYYDKNGQSSKGFTLSVGTRF
jgi:opacity protein-like surface antigen